MNLNNSCEEKLDYRSICSEKNIIDSNEITKFDEIYSLNSENEENYNLTTSDENSKYFETGKVSEVKY